MNAFRVPRFSMRFHSVLYRLFEFIYYPCTVSFDEFMAMFRSEREETSSTMTISLKSYEKMTKPNVDVESSDDDDDRSQLMGIDARIPGGKHESS